MEETFKRKGVKGICIGLSHIFILMYVNGLVLLAESASHLQNQVNVLMSIATHGDLKQK